MNDRILHLMKRASTGLEVLNKPSRQGVWQDQKPLRFTELVAEVAQHLDLMGQKGGEQELETTGTTADKKRERQELVESAHALSRAMTRCLRTAANETEAAKWDLTRSEWRNLADQPLAEKSDLLISAAAALTQGADAARAAKFGIDSDAITSATKERADFIKLMNLPVSTIAERRVVTLSLPVLAKQLREMLAELRDLILQFRKRDGGNDLIVAFKEAIKNRQGNGDDEDEDEPPTPPPVA